MFMYVQKIMNSADNVFHGKFDYGIDAYELSKSQKLFSIVTENHYLLSYSCFQSSKSLIFDFDISQNL